eukprot:scaffold65150_cov67-Phaeocystis_antarctica.AAC.10
MSAVLPLSVCSEASALASSSACTVAVWPSAAAAIRAVQPEELCRLTLAPRCSSTRTIASCPFKAAPVSNVAPPYSRLRASTPPPPSSHAATACALPFSAACHSLTGSPSPAAAGFGALANGAAAPAELPSAELPPAGPLPPAELPPAAELPPFVPASATSATSASSNATTRASILAAAAPPCTAALSQEETIEAETPMS